MHIVNCEHPITVYNKYIRKQLQVSCGKCKACLQARQTSWIRRLQDESRCWRYTFELYLDYNDVFLPSYDFSENGDYLVERQSRFYKSNVKDAVLSIPVKDLLTNDDASNDYVIERLNSHYTGLPHPSVRDIQLFKKRLNKYIYELTGFYKSFRSAIAAEIGPSTFRPHYHGILYFNDSRLAKEISRLCDKAWQDGHGNSLGHAYAKPDRGGTCSYVAKYICRPTDLPECYKNSALSTFFLTSRKPPIGSLLESNEDVRQIFLAASPQRIGFKVSKEQVTPCSVPVSSTLENRLFPKCPLYCQVSPALRVELYKCGISSRGLEVDFDDFRSLILRRITNFDLFYDVCDITEPKTLGQCKPSQFSELICQVTHGFESFDALRPLHQMICRIWYQAEIFGVSFDFYINQIFKYYDNKELLKLRSFYSFQQEYLKLHPLEEIWPMYQFYSEPESYKTTYDYRIFMKDTHHKWSESRKTIKKNAYFESLKVKDTPLYKLITNYYGKKCNEDAETSCADRP